MTQEIPKRGTRWLYTGPGHGQNIVHVVTGRFNNASGSSVANDSEVATWSDPVGEKPEQWGWSWLGPLNDFTRFFRRLAP